MNLSTFDPAELTAMYEGLLTKVFNDDMILALPVKTSEELETWKLAMSTGIHPTFYKRLADVVTEINSRKGMRNKKMPVRKSKRGRVFVGTPTFLI